MIPPYSRTEDAYGEKITTQTRVSTENAGDCLVVALIPGKARCERLDGS